MTGREIDFTIDKYKKPSYLSKRDSIAQVIQNGLFMRKGNLPSHPTRGVDIEQYLNKPLDSVNELQLLADLKNTCGDNLIDGDIESLTFQGVNYKGNEYALLLIKLKIDNTDDLLAISIQKTKKNVIRYQYNFINEDVPV
jgi:hypothetical protein